jgi:hypothetical protein
MIRSSSLILILGTASLWSQELNPILTEFLIDPNSTTQCDFAAPQGQKAFWDARGSLLLPATQWSAQCQILKPQQQIHFDARVHSNRLNPSQSLNSNNIWIAPNLLLECDSTAYLRIDQRLSDHPHFLHSQMISLADTSPQQIQRLGASVPKSESWTFSLLCKSQQIAHGELRGSDTLRVHKFRKAKPHPMFSEDWNIMGGQRLYKSSTLLPASVAMNNTEDLSSGISRFQLSQRPANTQSFRASWELSPQLQIQESQLLTSLDSTNPNYAIPSQSLQSSVLRFIESKWGQPTGTLNRVYFLGQRSQIQTAQRSQSLSNTFESIIQDSSSWALQAFESGVSTTQRSTLLAHSPRVWNPLLTVPWSMLRWSFPKHSRLSTQDSPDSLGIQKFELDLKSMSTPQDLARTWTLPQDTSQLNLVIPAGSWTLQQWVWVGGTRLLLGSKSIQIAEGEVLESSLDALDFQILSPLSQECFKDSILNLQVRVESALSDSLNVWIQQDSIRESLTRSASNLWTIQVPKRTSQPRITVCRVSNCSSRDLHLVWDQTIPTWSLDPLPTTTSTKAFSLSGRIMDSNLTGLKLYLDSTLIPVDPLGSFVVNDFLVSRSQTMQLRLTDVCNNQRDTSWTISSTAPLPFAQIGQCPSVLPSGAIHTLTSAGSVGSLSWTYNQTTLSNSPSISVISQTSNPVAILKATDLFGLTVADTCSWATSQSSIFLGCKTDSTSLTCHDSRCSIADTNLCELGLGRSPHLRQLEFRSLPQSQQLAVRLDFCQISFSEPAFLYLDFDSTLSGPNNTLFENRLALIEASIGQPPLVVLERWNGTHWSPQTTTHFASPLLSTMLSGSAWELLIPQTFALRNWYWHTTAQSAQGSVYQIPTANIIVDGQSQDWGGQQ